MMETVQSGTILNGHYRVRRVLGSGGFGHVYLSVDLKTNQLYALKEYLVTGAGGQVQLQHEAQVLSKLHHPSLPAFHEAFNEHGRYYVVLSYIEGSDLTDLIHVARRRNDSVALLRIMQWIVAVCDAVAFLHQQQPPVIHRDIKPDNIRIMPDGTAMLVDLGNAKATADGTRTLFFIRHQGTPGYAPQEQYPGGTGTDTRSDVYALGATLYFALTTHEPPSVSARNQAIQQGVTDLPSLQEQLAHNPPEDCSDPKRQFRLGATKSAKSPQHHSRHLAQLGTLSPAMLDQLNSIITRAMAMKPTDRYQSVVELGNELKNVVAALSEQATKPASRSSEDIHATQPDLSDLYEKMQAKKEPSQQVSQNGAPPSDAPSKSVPRKSCPRCNTPLVPHASFCLRCGTSLSNVKTYVAKTPPTTHTPIRATVQQHPVTRDSSTVTARPVSQVSSVPVLEHVPDTEDPSPIPIVPMPKNPPIRAMIQSKQPLLLIFALIILAVLVLITLLVMNQGHMLHSNFPSSLRDMFATIVGFN